MNFNDIINDYKLAILCGIVGTIILLLIFLIILAVRFHKLNNKYKNFISGKDGKTLEDTILSRFEDVDQLKENMDTLTTKVKEINDVLATTYQKVGIIKYDAFKEMGGKLSFALAMLDDSNSGFVLNSMHSSREGCYTYIKEIIRGESFVVLAEEEKQAIDAAMKSRNFME